MMVCRADEIEEKFDIIVCNFSLLGNESVNHLFQQAQFILNKGGGSWVGFNHKYRDPTP